MAELIFGRYVWVFEVTSALLITAALGAMVLAHRERLGKGPTSATGAVAGSSAGENLAGLPVPGVYARHNAVDTPALLPDGSIAELSVSRVLVGPRPDPLAAGRLRGRGRDRAEIEEGSER
jgi:NADH-quinone oxidoreductase subunit J